MAIIGGIPHFQTYPHGIINDSSKPPMNDGEHILDVTGARQASIISLLAHATPPQS